MNASLSSVQPGTRLRRHPLQNLLAIVSIVIGVLLVRYGFDGVFNYESPLSKLLIPVSPAMSLWNVVTGALLVLAGLAALMPSTTPE